MELNKFIYPESDKDVVDDFYREIWHENEYDRYFKINHGDKVIDCGAFIGMFSLYARDKGASQIIAIEADEERYNCLKQNCNNVPVTPLNRCINDNDADGSISIETIGHGEFTLDGFYAKEVKEMKTLLSAIPVQNQLGAPQSQAAEKVLDLNDPCRLAEF